MEYLQFLSDDGKKYIKTMIDGFVYNMRQVPYQETSHATRNADHIIINYRTLVILHVHGTLLW